MSSPLLQSDKAEVMVALPAGKSPWRRVASWVPETGCPFSEASISASTCWSGVRNQGARKMGCRELHASRLCRGKGTCSGIGEGA